MESKEDNKENIPPFTFLDNDNGSFIITEQNWEPLYLWDCKRNREEEVVEPATKKTKTG